MHISLSKLSYTFAFRIRLNLKMLLTFCYSFQQNKLVSLAKASIMFEFFQIYAKSNEIAKILFTFWFPQFVMSNYLFLHYDIEK